MWLKRAALFLYLASAGACGSITPGMAQFGAFPYRPVAPEGSHATNPPEIAAWFAKLHNRQGGSCCGEGDAYPVEIDAEPMFNGYGTDKLGEAHVIDPSARQVIFADAAANGRLEILNIQPITGKLNFTFYGRQVVPETFGNPLQHAIAFLRVEKGEIKDVYCVVPLPPGS